MAAREIVFITGNENKAREVGEILGFPIQHKKLNLTEIQGDTADDIVRAKAEEAFDSVPLRSAVLIEDTSLTFNTWKEEPGSTKGLPGPYIRHFMDTVGSEGLCRMLSPFADKSAEAVTIFAYYDGEEEVRLFPGVLKGSIADSPRGTNGFGWDNIFIPEGQPEGQRLTLAEMTAEQKNEISMRRMALEGLKVFLQEQNS